MGLDQLRVAVHPGAGVACRFRGSALVVTDGSGITEQVEELVEACRAADVDRLRSLGQNAGIPSFCALVDADDGILLLMSGVVAVNAVLTGRRMQFESTERAAFSEEKLRGDPITITVGKASMKPTSHPLLDLTEGVVLGSALEMAARGAPAPAAPTTSRRPAARPAEQVVAAPATSGSTVSLETSDSTVLMRPMESIAEEESVIAGQAFDSALTRSELPYSRNPGRLCKNGHENLPGATTCRICGLNLESAAAGARPLGRLMGPDGIDVAVAGNLIIGRRAAEAPEVIAGAAQAVGTAPDNQAVSRVHAEIRVDAGNVLLMDRNSANGTFVMPPDTTEWIRLEPGHGVMILPGTGIMIGPLELRFEAPA